MKQELTVNVEAKLQVSNDTANYCSMLLEIWLNEDPNSRKLEYKKLDNGDYTVYPVEVN